MSAVTPPRRVVSLCPSYTETVAALGAGSLLVGRTRYCIHPRALVAEVPHLGGTKDPDLDGIVALLPDLVLASQEENRQEDVEALQAAGIEVHVSFPCSPAEAAVLVEELGELMGRPERGRKLAEEIRTELVAAREGFGRPLDVAWLIWRDPWMVAGSDTYIGALLAEAGLRVTSPGRYPQLTVEELAEADILLLASEPYPFAEAHQAEVAGAVELAVDRVVLVDGELVGWPGSRTLAGLRYVRELARSLRG